MPAIVCLRPILNDTGEPVVAVGLSALVFVARRIPSRGGRERRRGCRRERGGTTECPIVAMHKQLGGDGFASDPLRLASSSWRT